MSAQTKQHSADPLTDKVRPIELQTENGFSILRGWEVAMGPPPLDGRYAFIVRDPNGREEEVVVEIADAVLTQTQVRTRNRIQRGNTFWICCVERHLANHVWEKGDLPADNKLTITGLNREDVMLALRWGSGGGD